MTNTQIWDEEKETLYNQLCEIYQIYRKALFNRKYYGHRLSSVKMWNNMSDIAVAVGTSSAIGAWVLWQNGNGEIAWGILAGTATLIAVIKPFLHFPQLIEKHSKSFTGHGDIFYDLERIIQKIKKDDKYTEQLDLIFQNILDHRKQLALDDDPKPNKKLLQRYYNEVNKEIPVSSLYIPNIKGGNK